MKSTVLFTFVLLSTTFAARADFSYTTTSRTTGGMMAGRGGGNTTAKYYFKGEKMETQNGDTATIIDFDAQTLTSINNRSKTITVRSLRDLGAPAGQSDVSVKVDVKETGQQKTINGYNAKELIMTMDIDSPQLKQMGKMQMEMDMWLSSDVPGVGELRDFYKKNMERMPWAALAGGVNSGMQQGMVEMQRKLAEMNGVQVQSVMKMKAAGGTGAPAMPQMSAAQTAEMQAAMARLQEMQKQGGPAAAAAAQAMARMGGMPGAASPGASNSMMEITTDASDFSTASIPDSVFAIPAGYQKVDAK